METGAPGNPGYSLNTNYSTPYLSQNQMLLNTIAAQQAAGNNINVVTLQLGANDLFVLTNSSAFQNMTPAQQIAAVTAVINTIATNDVTILGELKQLIPNAGVTVMGYYDPYGAFYNDPSSPLYAFAQLTHVAIPALNQAIASVVADFSDNFVNPYSAFVGNELAYTDIANNNVHPNALGYQVIGALLSVPEPSSVISMSLGVLIGGGWLIRGGRRRAA